MNTTKSVPRTHALDAARLQGVKGTEYRNRPASVWISKAAAVATAMFILATPFSIKTVLAGPFASAPRSVESSLVSPTDDTPDVHLIKQSPGSVALVFPLSGRVVKWKINFVFTTQCENDHRIVLTSPAGQKQTLMDRGLGRCSGKIATFTGESDDSTGAFLGSRAKGTWVFTMVDLDKNDFTGSLDEVQLKLTIKDKGKLSEHEVLFSGLPMAIPSAK